MSAAADPDSLEMISSMVDEIAMDKPVEWEKFNYEAIKRIAILGATEIFLDIKGKLDMDDEQKDLTLLSIISYLTLENTILWIQHHARMRDEEA